MTDSIAPDLEAAIEQGRRGEPVEIISIFVASNILVPSGAEVVNDMGELQPVLFDRQGIPMLAVFTNWDMPDSVRQMAPYVLQINAGALVRAIRPGTGVVVNPGSMNGFELLAERVEALRNELNSERSTE